MKKPKNTQGFSAIEIIIVLAVVVLIGGAIWYVLQSKQNEGKPATKITNTTSQQQTPATEESQTSTTQQLISDELAAKEFPEPSAAVQAYCDEQKIDCSIKLLYEDGTTAKIFDTGTSKGFYIVTSETGTGWKFNFLASEGCQTGTDHPGLAKYCAEKPETR